MVTDVRNMLGLDAVEYRDCRGFVSSMPLLWLESIGITWRSVDPKPLVSPESTDTTWRESNGLNALVWLEFAETTCSSDCPKPLFWLAFTEAAWRFDGPKRLVRFESTEISWTSVWGFNWTFLLTTDDSKGCLSSACFTWHIVLPWAFGGFSWTWARKWGCMLLVVSNCDSSWKESSSWFWGSTGLSRESFLLWKKVWSWWCWIILVWDSGWECACTKTLEASCATTGCPSRFTPWELRISVILLTDIQKGVRRLQHHDFKHSLTDTGLQWNSPDSVRQFVSADLVLPMCWGKEGRELVCTDVTSTCRSSPSVTTCPSNCRPLEISACKGNWKKQCESADLINQINSIT